jgi:hypothetical protein
MHKQLADASRPAGMAEIANNVLHDVGNVLNSVNVDDTTQAQGFHFSKAVGVDRAGELLRKGYINSAAKSPEAEGPGGQDSARRECA